MDCRSGIAGRHESIGGTRIETRQMGDVKSQTAHDYGPFEGKNGLLIATDGWCRETGQSPSRWRLGRPGLRGYEN
jgi:hypothetical protein